MAGEADLILAGINRLDGKLDQVQGTLSVSGERLASLETTKDQHHERIAKLEECTMQLTSAVTALPQQVQAALPCEKYDKRITPLEQQQQRSRGAIVAAGAAWSVLVVLPGLVAACAIWLSQGT